MQTFTGDQAYNQLHYRSSEIAHQYGEQLILLADPFHLSLLAKLCSHETKQPLISAGVKRLYESLFITMTNLFVTRNFKSIPTRMHDVHPVEGVFRGECLDDEASFVFVDLARAGILPTQVCYELAHSYFHADHLRQDHFYVGRRVNEKQEVVGVDLKGHKVGGDIKNRYVVIPDPMGATGGTVSHILKFYKSQVQGPAKMFVALHLIVTPEYVLRMKKEHPDVMIIALRLDRGLSGPGILQEVPGKKASEEKGLNEHQYIVPGAGGVGELLNNSFV